MAQKETDIPDLQHLNDAKRTTCTYHCSACGLHFHSLKAFDTHRKGDYASGRECAHPFDLYGKLLALTEEGECRMYDDGSGQRVKRGATVWTHAGDYHRLVAARGSQRSHEAEVRSDVDLAPR